MQLCILCEQKKTSFRVFTIALFFVLAPQPLPSPLPDGLEHHNTNVLGMLNLLVYSPHDESPWHFRLISTILGKVIRDTKPTRNNAGCFCFHHFLLHWWILVAISWRSLKQKSTGSFPTASLNTHSKHYFTWKWGMLANNLVAPNTCKPQSYPFLCFGTA